jgi:hypothetical protein
LDSVQRGLRRVFRIEPVSPVEGRPTSVTPKYNRALGRCSGEDDWEPRAEAGTQARRRICGTADDKDEVIGWPVLERIDEGDLPFHSAESS